VIVSANLHRIDRRPENVGSRVLKNFRLDLRHRTLVRKLESEGHSGDIEKLRACFHEKHWRGILRNAYKPEAFPTHTDRHLFVHRFFDSLDRSIARSLARSIDRSIARFFADPSADAVLAPPMASKLDNAEQLLKKANKL
jgi:hypothetical protein